MPSSGRSGTPTEIIRTTGPSFSIPRQSGNSGLREAYEETQLGVLSAELLHEEEVRDECRRGADYHFWHLYLCQCTGEPRMSDEGDVIGWFTRDEITGELPLTRPTGYFLGQLFGETGRNVRGR